jgi:outer membrane protein insertion porin family
VFADVGSLWSVSNDDPSINDDADPRASVGAGVTWSSPFGPLGVDVGYGFIRQGYDETEILRVSFGTRF